MSQRPEDTRALEDAVDDEATILSAFRRCDAWHRALLLHLAGRFAEGDEVTSRAVGNVVPLRPRD